MHANNNNSDRIQSQQILTSAINTRNRFNVPPTEGISHICDSIKTIEFLNQIARQNGPNVGSQVATKTIEFICRYQRELAALKYVFT